MTMQTLAVVIGCVEMNRLLRGTQILNINMVEAPHFCMNTAVKGVIRMTGVASFISRYAVILKVGCGNVVRVIHHKTLAIWFHHVTGQTKVGLFRMLNLFGCANESA